MPQKTFSFSISEKSYTENLASEDRQALLEIEAAAYLRTAHQLGVSAVDAIRVLADISREYVD